MKNYKTINQNKADIEIGYKEQKQHLIDIMKSDEDLGLYEEPKQETIKEVAERYVDSFEYSIAHPRRVAIKSFINGAKWQQEKNRQNHLMTDEVGQFQFSKPKMYSEEEVIKILYQFHYDLVNSNFDTKEEWFEQFKKK